MILVVAVAWFDVVAPDDFARVTAEALKNRLQLTSVPNLTYLRAVLRFTLLGLTLRYCQASLNVEREYRYLHQIEAILAEHVHSDIGREGVNYRKSGKPFLDVGAYYLHISVPCSPGNHCCDVDRGSYLAGISLVSLDSLRDSRERHDDCILGALRPVSSTDQRETRRLTAAGSSSGQTESQVFGLWWDPAKPDEKWAGTLRLGRKGRGRLTLIAPPPSFQAFMTSREYSVLSAY